MAPPLIFNERDLRYKIGTGILLLGTVFAIFGIISPGWYSIAHAWKGTSGYSHLWIFCSDGLYDCSVLGSSNTQSFERASQAFVIIGILVLFAACLLGVFFNFVTHSRDHNRWLEISALIGGGFIFLGAIIFVAAGSSYIADPNRSPPLDQYSLSFGYALAMTFVAAILVIGAGVLIFIFNRPLLIPSDTRTLSSLRNNDPVDRMHDDVENDEGGFRTAQLRAASLSSPPPTYESQCPGGISRPKPSRRSRLRASLKRGLSRGRGRGARNRGGRSARVEDPYVVSGDLGTPSDNFRVGRSNPAYVPDPNDAGDHDHGNNSRPDFPRDVPSQSFHGGRSNLAYDPDPSDASDVHNQPGDINHADSKFNSGVSAQCPSYNDYEILRRQQSQSYETLRQEPYGNSYVNNNVLTARQHSMNSQGEQNDSRMYPQKATDRGKRHQAPPSRQPRHFSEGQEADMSRYVNVTPQMRQDPRHLNDRRQDDKDDDGGFRSWHKGRPRHYSEGSQLDRHDDANFTPDYSQQPRHHSDRGQSGESDDIFMVSGRREELRHYERPEETRHYDKGAEMQQRHIGQSGHTRHYANMPDRGEAAVFFTDLAHGERERRRSDDVTETDIDMPLGVPPPPYPATEV